MKPFNRPVRFLRSLLLSGALAASGASQAVTILQSPGSTAIAWEAENHGAYLNDPFNAPAAPRVVWTPTNDLPASGGQVLYARGENITAAPVSFVDYQLRFAAPGTYKLYYRWKADVTWVAGDLFTANSFYAPLMFNARTNLEDFVNAQSNGVDSDGAAPWSTNYSVLSEPATFEVTQGMVDGGEILVLRIGTRERGMMLDRFVLSTDQGLSEGGFSAIPNSDVDIFVQPPGATHVAFEAETPKASYLNDPFNAPAAPRVQWVPTNDVAGSGGQVLYALGQNVTAAPLSFVDYRIQFSGAGTYKFYYRWKADVAWVAGDLFTANSFYAPLAFNARTNLEDYVNAQSNGLDSDGAAPWSTNYSVLSEPATFEVSQSMVDTKEVVTLRLGTRERGMMLDRIALSTDQGLSEGGFNALPNTGVDNKAPEVVSVSGSLDFTNATIVFDEPIDPTSLDIFNFQASGGLQVLNITLDMSTLKTLYIQTSQQVPSASYTITFSGLRDVANNTVPADSQATFQAWGLQTGWVTREIYGSIPGSVVSDLTAAPNYPNSPDSINTFNAVSMENSPRGNNYGMRLRCFFIPPATDTYDFYIYADDQAELSLSLDETPGGLMPLVTTMTPSSAYDPGVKGGLPFDTLVAGQRYLLQVLFKQGLGDARLGVAAARNNPGLQGGFNPAALPPLIELRGDVISTYINPATASVNITKQPQGTNVTVGYSARFEVAATSPAGAVAVQWQVNGVDIPGATRPVYVTPALSLADDGKHYRALAIAGGVVAPSMEAIVGVNPGQPPATQPYIGINFVGGGGPIEGFLSAPDIAGAVPQANFNNIDGATQTAAPLKDADGNATPVTLTYAAAVRYTGTGTRSADDTLFEGYIQNNNMPMTVTLSGMPPGTYGLLAYSVGFDFQTIYDQAYELVGAVTYPVFHVEAQAGGQYRASPGYKRMFSTDPNARDSGNYVMFENVSPDGAGNLTLNLTPEPPATPGVGDAMPALNALQLVRLVTALPALTIVRNPNGTATVSWGADAAGFTLESTASLGIAPAPNWQPASGAPNPITSAGSINLPGPGNLFLRLRQ